jgi:hypothetical protein
MLKIDLFTTIYILVKMSLVPLSKKSMQELNGSAEEERHVQRVKETITKIYTNAIKGAKERSTSYSECICTSINLKSISTIEIAKGVQALFPDCTITLRTKSPLTHPTLIKYTLADSSIVVYEFPPTILNGVVQSWPYDLHIDWSSV